MNVDVKSIGFEKETEGNCHMKNEVNVLADSSTNCIASMDNNTNYVNVGEARYGGDFRYVWPHPVGVENPRFSSGAVTL